MWQRMKSPWFVDRPSLFRLLFSGFNKSVDVHLLALISSQVYIV